MASAFFRSVRVGCSKGRRGERRELCRKLCSGLEALEDRNLLSASSVVLSPMLDVVSPLKSTGSSVTNPTVVGFTPAQVKAAYGFAGVTGTGAGQTIAIVDAYNDPNIASDLAAFDSAFGLAAANLKVVSQTGSTTALPSTNADWALEISLDVEWAHAVAPGANILLVEANSANWSDLETAVDYAKKASGVSVVSMSWGGGEYSTETSDDSTFIQSGVTFVASAGDDGSPASYPATSPDVLSVGGTTLNLTSVTSTGATYGSESAWSDGGGGISAYEKEPAYQKAVQTNSSGNLVSPDVAWDADPNSGVAVYDTLNDGYGTGWIELGGTSVGALSWSGLLADANQQLVAAGKSVLGSNAMSDLFDLPASAYRDITTGGNGTYNAGTGFDAVTGLGTPIAKTLISDLVSGTTGSPTSGVVTIAPITHSGGGGGGSGSGGGGGGGGGHGGHGGHGGRNGYGQYDTVSSTDAPVSLVASTSTVATTESAQVAAPSLSFASVALPPLTTVESASAQNAVGGGSIVADDVADRSLLVGVALSEQSLADANIADATSLDRSDFNGPSETAAPSPQAVDMWFDASASIEDMLGSDSALAGPRKSDARAVATDVVRIEAASADSTSHASSLAALALVFASIGDERPNAVQFRRRQAIERRWLERLR